MSYRAVLFDMDGVIVDSEPLHIAAFQASLKRYGRNLSEEQYKQHFAGKTDEAGFRHYFDRTGEAVQPHMPVIVGEKSKIYLDLAADKLIPYVGAVELIRALVSRNVPLALVTGSLRAEAEAVLDAFSLTECFAAVVAAENITQSKPSPEGYLQAAQALNVEPKDCLVIEDAPSGVRAANAAGMRCLAVTNTHSKQELQEATAVVSQLHSKSLDAL